MTYDELCLIIINDFNRHYSNYLVFDTVACMPLYLKDGELFYQPYPMVKLAFQENPAMEDERYDRNLNFPEYRDVPVLESGFRELKIHSAFKEEVEKIGFHLEQTLNVLLPVHILELTHQPNLFFPIKLYRTMANMYRIYRPYFPGQNKKTKLITYGSLANQNLELNINRAERFSNLLTFSYDTAKYIYTMDPDFIRSTPYAELSHTQKQIVENRLSVIAALKLEQVI